MLSTRSLSSLMSCLAKLPTAMGAKKKLDFGLANMDVRNLSFYSTCRFLTACS